MGNLFGSSVFWTRLEDYISGNSCWIRLKLAFVSHVHRYHDVKFMHPYGQSTPPPPPILQPLQYDSIFSPHNCLQSVLYVKAGHATALSHADIEITGSTSQMLAFFIVWFHLIRNHASSY